MKASDIVTALYPTAKLETHKENGVLGRKYFLVRIRGEYNWIGCGDTPSQAWNDALPKVLERAKEAIKKSKI